MLGPSRNRPRTLLTNPGGETGIRSAGVDIDRLRRLGHVALELVGGDEIPLALVPLGQDLGGRGTAEDARVDQAGKLDVRNMPGCAVDALKVPDRLGAGGVWKFLSVFSRSE